MKYLLLKPGFLPMEYIKGKRASYLNPIKKYVFTSAVFFIIFFSILKGGDKININMGNALTAKEKTAYFQKAEEVLQKDPNNELWLSAMKMLKDTSRVLTQEDMRMYWDDFDFINLDDRNYKNRQEYDSVQQSLPAAERDGWFERLLQRKNLKWKEKYKNDPKGGATKLFDIFLHKLPYMLFVSLPLFALILKLLYVRRKNFYYADHGIFSIYHYIFTFILLLLVFGSDKLSDLTGLGVFDVITVLLFLSGGVYLYLSMKRFYGQGHVKTMLKYILLNLIGFLLLMILFIGFLLFSVFEI